MTYFNEKTTFINSNSNSDAYFKEVQNIIGNVILDQILNDHQDTDHPEIDYIDLPQPVEGPQPQPVEAPQPQPPVFENRPNLNPNPNNFNLNFGFNLEIYPYLVYYKYHILLFGSSCLLIAATFFILKNVDLSDFFISKSNKTLDEKESLINKDFKNFNAFNFQEKLNVLKHLNLKKFSLKLKKKG